MSSPEDAESSDQRLAVRVTAIEEWMMHCDRMLQTLNEVVVTMQNRLDSLQLSVDRLSETTRTLSGRVSEGESTPEEERPPHY